MLLEVNEESRALHKRVQANNQSAFMELRLVQISNCFCGISLRFHLHRSKATRAFVATLGHFGFNHMVRTEQLLQIFVLNLVSKVAHKEVALCIGDIAHWRGFLDSRLTGFLLLGLSGFFRLFGSLGFPGAATTIFFLPLQYLRPFL